MMDQLMVNFIHDFQDDSFHKTPTTLGRVGLQEEVEGKFSTAASGQPPSISTAQLVQKLVEVGR